MEQVRLVWQNSAQQLTSGYQLNNKWQSYANQHKLFTFEMVTSSNERCRRALEQLKKRPDSLGSLELQYVLHGSRASRKQITVTGQHILQGKMYAKLKNKVGTDGNVYLNSEDLNKFSYEVVSTVTASSMTDSDYVDTGDSLSLSKLIYDSLSTFKQNTARMTPKMWKSTFWQDDFARPDKLTSYLNKLFTKDKGKNNTITINDLEIGADISATVEGSALFGLIRVDASMSASVDYKSHVSEDELREWLNERNHHVEWSGEKFEVKPVDLYRLNTQQLEQEQNIATTYVQVHQVQYMYNVKVSFPRDRMDNSAIITTAAINKRLDQLERAVRYETTNRKSKDVKVGTLNASVKQLDSLTNSHEDQLKEMGWTRSHKYCIWKCGSCPPDFTEITGRQLAIQIHSFSSVYSTWAYWGSSSIQKHCPDCGNNDFDLHISVCCKN